MLPRMRDCRTPEADYNETRGRGKPAAAPARGGVSGRAAATSSGAPAPSYRVGRRVPTQAPRQRGATRGCVRTCSLLMSETDRAGALRNPGFAARVPAEQDARRRYEARPRRGKPVRLAVDDELTDRVSLIRDRRRDPARLVRHRRMRGRAPARPRSRKRIPAQIDRRVLRRARRRPRAARRRRHRRCRGCRRGPRGRASSLFEVGPFECAHLTRRSSSGIGHGRRCTVSTRTTVCVAVTMSASSGSRYAAHS